MPLNSEPPLTHEQFDRINKLLHAHYALGGLPRCVAEGGEALEQCRRQRTGSSFPRQRMTRPSSS